MDPLRDSTGEHLAAEHDGRPYRTPSLQLDFYFDSRGFAMEQSNNGHMHTGAGATLHNTNGGPGGMAADLMTKINEAIAQFELERNFRVGSKIASEGGLTRGIIKVLDFEEGTALLECGGVVRLKRMVTKEY